jgi:CRP-like cAMP-binding protein
VIVVSYAAAFQKGLTLTVSRLEQFLSSVPVLASLTPEQLAVLAARTTERQYPAGELILRAGERNRTLYFLQSGRLAV